MTIWHEIGLLLLMTAFNGLFTGAEIAMLSVRRTRLEELADDGNRAAAAALKLRRAPETLLATIQVGITVLGATTAVVGGARLAKPLEALLAQVGLARFAEPIAFTIVILLVSYLSLVIGELVPKSLALQAPERFALMVSRPLQALAKVSRPVVWLLTASSNLVLKPFRDSTNFAESRLSPDELQQLVEESAATGALHAGAGEIASRAIDLAKLKANSLMIPRQRIVALSIDATDDEIRDLLQRCPHARYPVYEGHVEKTLGYVLGRELYEALLRGSVSLRELLRPVAYFPEGAPALDVLRALQASKRQLALIVEEDGGIAGLLTIEDIAEDLFGEIMEEHETPRISVWKDAADGSIVALGDAPLHEVSRLLGEELDDDTTATTIAGLVTEAANRVPTSGERTNLTSRVEAEVLEASPRQISRVRLTLRPPEGN